MADATPVNPAGVECRARYLGSRSGIKDKNLRMVSEDESKPLEDLLGIVGDI